MMQTSPRSDPPPNLRRCGLRSSSLRCGCGDCLELSETATRRHLIQYCRSACVGTASPPKKFFTIQAISGTSLARTEVFQLLICTWKERPSAPSALNSCPTCPAVAPVLSLPGTALDPHRCRNAVEVPWKVTVLVNCQVLSSTVC